MLEEYISALFFFILYGETLLNIKLLRAVMKSN
jgi:hypothetical protein